MSVSFFIKPSAPFQGFAQLESERNACLKLCHADDLQVMSHSTINELPIASEEHAKLAPLPSISLRLLLLSSYRSCEPLVAERISFIGAGVVSGYLIDQVVKAAQPALSSLLSEPVVWMDREVHQAQLEILNAEPIDASYSGVALNVSKLEIDLFATSDSTQLETRDRMLQRRITRLDLFMKELELQQAKADLYLKTAESLHSNLSRLALVAGVIVLIASKAIHDAMNLYLASHISLTLKGVRVVLFVVGLGGVLNYVIETIRRLVGLDHLMKLGEYQKTLHFFKKHLDEVKDLDDKLSVVKPDDENNPLALSFRVKFAEARTQLQQCTQDFEKRFNDLGWISSKVFTASPERALLAEIVFPSSIPLAYL